MEMNRHQQFKRFGLVLSLQAAIFSRLARHLNLHVWSIQTRPLYADYVLPEKHANNFEFKRLTLDDAVLASNDPALGLSEDFVRTAFKRRDICVGAYHKESLVGYTWRSLSCAPITNGLWIRIDKQPQRYGYNALVREAFRGQRLSASITRFYDGHFVDAGIHSDVGYIALHNLPSLVSSYRNGDRTLRGYAGYWKVGNRYWTFRTKGARKYIELESSDDLKDFISPTQLHI